MELMDCRAEEEGMYLATRGIGVRFRSIGRLRYPQGAASALCLRLLVRAHRRIDVSTIQIRELARMYVSGRLPSGAWAPQAQQLSAFLGRRRHPSIRGYLLRKQRHSGRAPRQLCLYRGP